MSKIRTALRLWNNNKRDLIIPFYNYLVKTGILNHLSDVLFLEQGYLFRFGKKLDLKNPKTFNEKLNWLKINDRRPLYTLMVDKYEAKKIVADCIGYQYVIPTLAVYDSVEEVDLSKLPNKFVIKCTHDSGGVSICKDKTHYDYSKARHMLMKHQRKNAFYWAREWPYLNVKPRILVEEYVESIEEVLVVYKVFCFHGHAELIQVIQNDKTDKETVDYFDREWNWLELCQDYPNSDNPMPKPKALDEMIILSESFLPNRPFLRVDWYIVNDRPIFSEFTFFSDAGMAHFVPEYWDERLGTLMDLESLKESL